MAEYIEREALRDELLNISIDISNLYGCGILEGLDRATKRLNEQLAADVAPVVRCKDCEYYNRDNMSPGTGWCECLERGEYENHFCSYGERKEGAD